MSRLGQKLKDIRTKKGLAPKALAKKVGVSEKFILEVEDGRRIMNDSLATRLSKVLGVNLNENGDFYASLEERRKETRPSASVASATKATQVHTPARRTDQGGTPAPQWEQAFSSIILDVPIYDSSMNQVVSTKKLVIQDNKVEGIPVDKAFYIMQEEKNAELSPFQKGDLILIYKMNEVNKAGLYVVRWQNEVHICEAKPLDNKRLLMGSPKKGPLSAEAVGIQEITVLGKCIRVETPL